MHVVGLIPARLQSTRLPRKLLLNETGKPLIQYVWEAANATRSLNEVIVATDSEEIAAAVHHFGGRAEMTGEHPSGTDRIAEVVRRCCANADVVVNLQGDEPELDPAHIDLLVATLRQHPHDEMATLATALQSAADVRDPNCVKVVRAVDGRALYFSRSVVPHIRGVEPDAYFEIDAKMQATLVASGSGLSTLDSRLAPWLLHLGIYAYRREFLLRLTTLPPSPLEQLEKLEQLRALEHGATIRVAVVENAGVGIDTPEDYARFVRRQQARAA
jgi:3-deoxy-manno-octulosonate cytidylyltransferase (CMP-KDO synthetase)